MSENQQQILDCEKQLLLAFETKNIAVLEKFLHENSLFVLPNGLCVTKTEVLNNYRNGNMDILSIKPSDYKIQFTDNIAVVTLNMEMAGKYNEQTYNTLFRYMRVWKLENNTWKVIATSGLQL